MSSYIYLVECADGKQKIGRTAHIEKMRQAIGGKCTLVHTSCVPTNYVAQIEADIITELMTSQTFDAALSHGLEYFHGDTRKMVEIIERHVKC